MSDHSQKTSCYGHFTSEFHHLSIIMSFNKVIDTYIDNETMFHQPDFAADIYNDHTVSRAMVVYTYPPLASHRSLECLCSAVVTTSVNISIVSDVDFLACLALILTLISF